MQKYWGGWKPGAAASVQVPAEPAPKGPAYVHVPWATPTLPYLAVGFRAPAFSETDKDYAAMDMVAALYFGETSDLYKKLVVNEQKVDQFFADNPGNVDPALFTVLARVKKADDAIYVRDEILKTAAQARSALVSANRLDEAKSFNRYSLARGLDSTERVAELLARFVHYRRSYDTINHLFRVYDALTPADLQAAAGKYFTDAGLILTTLSKEPLADGIATAPAIASMQAPSPASTNAAATAPRPGGNQPRPVAPGRDDTIPAASAFPLVVQKSVTPQLDIKLLFAAGSAADPAGKEGLAFLSAAMIAEAGSKAMTIDEINAALYPMAGSFTAQVDKEMTTFTGMVHRDNWPRFADVVLRQLLAPGFREDDFRRLREAQLNALVEDLRGEQRGGTRQGTAPGQHLQRDTLRSPGARHRGRHQCDHAR